MNDSHDQDPLSAGDAFGGLDPNLEAAVERATRIADETPFSEIQRSQQELRFESKQASQEVDQWRNRLREMLSHYRTAANTVRRIQIQTQKLQGFVADQPRQAPQAESPQAESPQVKTPQEKTPHDETPRNKPSQPRPQRPTPAEPELASFSDSNSAGIAWDEPDDRPQEGGLICGECKKELPENAAFCLHCGVKVEAPKRQAVCGSCGLELPEEAKFCFRCGAKTSTPDAALTPQRETQRNEPPLADKEARNAPAVSPDPPVLAEPISPSTPTPSTPRSSTPTPPSSTVAAVCGKCGAAMQGKKFCTQCGGAPAREQAARSNACGRCQAVNKPNTKFCTRCGNSLS